MRRLVHAGRVVLRMGAHRSGERKDRFRVGIAERQRRAETPLHRGARSAIGRRLRVGLGRGALAWGTHGHACLITPVDASAAIDKPLSSVDVFDGV